VDSKPNDRNLLLTVLEDTLTPLLNRKWIPFIQFIGNEKNVLVFESVKETKIGDLNKKKK